MGWDASRPVPWQRMMREWLLYVAIMLVILVVLFRDQPLVGIVAVGAVLVPLGGGCVRAGRASADRLISIAAGGLLLFVGVAMLSSHLVRPLAAVVGLPARRAGGAARAARSAARRAPPCRTVATGGRSALGSSHGTAS